MMMMILVFVELVFRFNLIGYGERNFYWENNIETNSSSFEIFSSRWTTINNQPISLNLTLNIASSPILSGNIFHYYQLFVWNCLPFPIICLVTILLLHFGWFFKVFFPSLSFIFFLLLLFFLFYSILTFNIKPYRKCIVEKISNFNVIIIYR